LWAQTCAEQNEIGMNAHTRRAQLIIPHTHRRAFGGSRLFQLDVYRDSHVLSGSDFIPGVIDMSLDDRCVLLGVGNAADLDNGSRNSG
jgi:hypothetical protein